MSKFRKNKSKESPGVSTASLPDIVFTVLAFFIVVSSMKQVDLKIDVNKPSANETIQLDKNEAIDFVNAGIPVNTKAFGKAVRLQLDDQIEPNYIKIRDFIRLKRLPRTPNENKKATVSIRADKKKVDMSIVEKIEFELREMNALRISYSTEKEVPR